MVGEKHTRTTGLVTSPRGAIELDRIDELRVFVAVADGGSLSAAARALRVSVNQVSRKLARLEQRVHQSLITRTTRRMKLTSEGERLLARCRRILDEVQAAELEAAGVDRPIGKLKLAIPTLLTHFGLLAELARLRETYPDLAVELLVGDEPIELMATGCDLVVTAVRPADSGLTMIKLGRLKPVLAAHRAYLARAGTPTSPEELKDHVCLRFESDEAQTHWQLQGPGRRRRKVRVGGGFSANDSRVLFDALLSGVGIGVVTEPELRGRVELNRVLPGYRFTTFDLFALYHPRQSALMRTRLAIDLLRRCVVSAERS